MDSSVALNRNRLVAFLQKPAKDFTINDIKRYIVENGIEMINFMYPAGDGRLKTLNFVINDEDYLDSILSQGERVDGSSLFAHIEPGNSDLYVIPKFHTAFLDPFAEIPTVIMLCAFFDKDGNRLANSPDYTLEKACSAFRDVTGLTFQAMGELEYYVIFPADGTFPAVDQKGYHESAPFVKTGDFRTRCMSLIAAAGGRIKYGHSEVGNFTLDGLTYEQNEIEFLPVDGTEAADQLSIAKWVIRRLAEKEGYNITFAPKITTGKAGSGLHVHLRLLDGEGRNVMLDSCGNLSNDARTAIAGMMDMARSITAFGIFPSRPPSGGSYEYMLGRPQPFGPRKGSARMEHIGRSLRKGQSGKLCQRRVGSRASDRRDPFGRRIGRRLLSHCCDRCSLPSRMGDARSAESG